MGRKIKKDSLVRKRPPPAQAEQAAEDPSRTLLSGDLRAAADTYGYGADPSNALVLPAKRKAEDDGDGAREGEPAKKRRLSAKRRKQLEKVVERKQKKAVRAELLESLAKSALDPSQMSLLRPTASIGQAKETAKERMRRRLQEERAGIAHGEDTSRLHRKGPVIYEDVTMAQAPAESSDSDSDGDEAEDAMEVDEQPPSGGKPDAAEAKPVQPAPQVYRAPPQSSSAFPPRTPITAEDRARAFYVNVKRDAKVQEGRLRLPILAEEQRIMEAIRENDVVVICGETGSGKTTQVPQFLYEAGYGSLSPESPHKGLIGVTEPRRVAAISMAARVASELGLSQKEVSYQIRYEATAGASTSIKFMTDGVLLKEIESDFLLQKYSAIVIDEAHERSVNTDVLIGLLSRIVPLRAKLCAEDKKKRADAVAQAAKEREERDKEAQRQASKRKGAEAKSKGKAAEARVVREPVDEATVLAGMPSVQPLKLIIMSATLRVEDFAANRVLFPTPPPVLSVDARQYPVTIHFNKRTELVDYVGEAFKKVCKIHKKLPGGGILVFVTGQNEVNTLCRKLRRRFPTKRPPMAAKGASAAKGALSGSGAAASGRTIDLNAFSVAPQKIGSASALGDESGGLMDDFDADADLAEAMDEDGLLGVDGDEGDDYSEEDEGSDSEEEVEGDAAEEGEEWAEEDAAVAKGGPLHVLPLYSVLPSAQQMKVFEAPPRGKRLVVVATNVAETSLTIPNIRYVVDTGRVKQRLHDARTGIASYEVGWASRASADQRSGRAGRTGPGHCYRLFSSAVFTNDFEAFSPPEILRMPIDGLVLQMRAMGIDNPVGFPFPTPPERDALAAADTLLRTLGAIDPVNGRVTDLGRRMSKFPLAPRYARMVCAGVADRLTAHVIAMVSALTVGEIYAFDAAGDGDDDGDDSDGGSAAAKKKLSAAARARAKFATEGTDSDVVAMLRAVGAWEYAGGTEAFCAENGLRHKAMVEIRKLRRQLTDIANAVADGPQQVELNPKMAPPSARQMTELRKTLLAGFGDRVAQRVPAVPADGKRSAYQSVATDERVYIHPSSSLLRAAPQMVVYHEIVETTRPYMRLVTKIDPAWLATVVPALCTFGKPLENPPPTYDPAADTIRCHIGGTFGPHMWPLVEQPMEYPPCADRYRWFARFLLEGRVVPSLAAFADKLLSQPMVMNKGWAQERVAAMLQALADAGVHTREGLYAKWRTDPRFLLSAYALWVNRGHHGQLMAVWPPIEAK